MAFTQLEFVLFIVFFAFTYMFFFFPLGKHFVLWFELKGDINELFNKKHFTFPSFQNY